MKNNELKRAHTAIQTIADKEGIPVDKVREEMKSAISEGLSDHSVQEIWKEIPCKGKTPEPEELIAWIAEQVRERMKN